MERDIYRNKIINDIVKNSKLPFKTIHIVGTNGKGSNAKYINDELILNNYKVGLFTSPHILKFNERIKINNIDISDKEYQYYYDYLIKKYGDYDYHWFDKMFFIALLYFIDNKVDIAILEAGIGAKKDVVNMINHNYLLITSISLDHTNLIGNDIKQIAQDKSCAIKSKVITYVPDSINKSLIKILEDKAIKENSKLIIIDTNKDTFETINIDLSKSFLKKEFNINCFKSDFQLPIGRANKFVFNNYNCYLDVSHNIEAFEQSFKYYNFHNIKFDSVLISLSKDKDYRTIFKFVKKHFNKIYCYENKGLKPLDINYYDNSFTTINNIELFIKNINENILFIGSFYLIDEVLSTLNKLMNK